MRWKKWIPLLVVLAGAAAYHNTFRVPFLFDSEATILDNPSIRHLWPIWDVLAPSNLKHTTAVGRPIFNLSLAINYALGGRQVWTYHVGNLAIHILAGLALLGVVRRTLRGPRLRKTFGGVADGLALAVALLWVVHPLQTESVTYVVQRVESQMGLFFLLTLYCFIRGTESERPALWFTLAGVTCALGMGTKEVMAVAPLVVLLYDWTFVAGSWRDVWRRRWPVHLTLAATWLLLGFYVAAAGVLKNVVIARTDLTWWQYLLTQPGVILHYLRLTLWPHPLCLDYWWPIADNWKAIALPGIPVALLVGGTIGLCVKRSPWGFLGAWFFLILAPTSSILPISDPAFEHRMYLSLAAVVAAWVIVGYRLVMRFVRENSRRSVTSGLVAVLALTLGWVTVRRNAEYRTELGIWAHTLALRPENPRAYNNLGNAQLKLGRLQEAMANLEESLRLAPNYTPALHNMGVVFLTLGKHSEAIEFFAKCVQFDPWDDVALYDLGVALLHQGQTEEAIRHFAQVVKLRPDDAEVHNNLGNALLEVNKPQNAIPYLEKAVRIEPRYTVARYNLAMAYLRTGGTRDAILHLEEALRINPNYAEAHNNLGFIRAQDGDREEAIHHFEEALRCKPNYADAHNNLGYVLMDAGKLEEAIPHFQAALQIRPDYAEAHNNLANTLFQLGRVDEATAHWAQVRRKKNQTSESGNQPSQAQP